MLFQLNDIGNLLTQFISFNYILYLSGGLVFLIIWMLFLFLWSSPLLIIEYGTGRYTRKGVLGSFRQFLGDNFIWCGAWICMVSFCIRYVKISFLSIVWLRNNCKTVSSFKHILAYFNDHVFTDFV